MPNLYFVRHAESEANVKREYAGHLPVSITKEGGEEARHAATQFRKDHQIHRIISSTLLRAKQTAKFFADAFQLPIEEDSRVMEQDMGIYCGKEYAWCEKHPQFEIDVGNRWGWRPPEGESYQEVAERIIPFFKDLENSVDQNIMIVSHGVALRLIRSILENTLPTYYTGLSKNCEILHCQFTKLNNSHLVETIYYGDSNKLTHRE